jgi:hypothetical protein
MRPAMHEELTLEAEEAPALAAVMPTPGEQMQTDGDEALVAVEEVPVFDDEFPILADDAEPAPAGAEYAAAAEGAAADPRLAEMRDVLDMLRESEISDALRLLRQLFPHIPFPFRVRALMAARHGAVAS